MKRDDLLLRWAERTLPASPTWHDIGAGNGSVSRALKKVRPMGSFTCWDPKPKDPNVHLQMDDFLPSVPVDFVLFNFVLHHVGVEMRINRYILNAFKLCNFALVVQEDLDDGTEDTKKKLHWHDPLGFYLSISEWLTKLSRFCPEHSRIVCIPHSEPATDVVDYHIPRALFIVYK